MGKGRVESSAALTNSSTKPAVRSLNCPSCGKRLCSYGHVLGVLIEIRCRNCKKVVQLDGSVVRMVETYQLI